VLVQKGVGYNGDYIKDDKINREGTKDKITINYYLSDFLIFISFLQNKFLNNKLAGIY